ncbi:MAG: sigma-54-dependent Fis family transcriptional regulator [Balneolaceae bacterium]|nr:MAG: sigma-54-dependent Fis family transcriptional regulator [Balneolaceae bacterium]
MKGRIVLIDDDKLLLSFMDEHLSMAGYETKAFNSPVKAIDYLKENSADLIITDVKMNEMTGDEILNEVRSNYPQTGVIMITGFGNVNHAVNALRKGAFDYVTKPFKAKELSHRIERFFETEQVSLQDVLLDDQEGAAEFSNRKSSAGKHVKRLDTEPETGGLKFVGEDPMVKKLMMILPRIAQNDAPVMIEGESGTGKEVFAHQVHAQSNRHGKPYIKINCANLPTELVESTLFGHMKGAFTGAISDQKGAFDEANGGTLLLDEITEIDINVQAKLLRVLQEKEFYRVGSQKPIQADVRIIATSNKNIAKAITDGEFREDLYFRLNVFPITIPPLRNRPGDIPVLANYFVERYRERYQLGEKKISEEVMTYFTTHEWRGNVRELDNKIHRGIILSHESKTIELEHIQNNLFSNADDDLSGDIFTDMPLMSIEDMELQLIKKTLEHTRGNQKQAAEILGISDRTIRNKLKNYEI